jgi:phospholipase C
MTKRRLSAYCKSVVAGVLFGLPHANAQGSASIPIEHFIFIVQENHSFDNYFGTFPGANGIPAGTALADYPGGPLTNQPFLLHEETVPHDLDHGWLTAKVVWGNGAMDGFLWGEYNEGTKYYGKGIPVPTPNPALVKLQKKRTASQRQAKVNGEILSPHGFADDEDEDAPDVEEQNEALRATDAVPSSSPNPKDRPKWVIDTLGYWDNTIIPNYWEYARKFTLCDAFFSSLTGPSVPNHLYIVSAQSGGLVNDESIGKTKLARYSFPSIIELLGQGNVTWKYYSGTIPTLENIWKPLPGFRAYAESIDKNFKLDSHLERTSEFYKDLKAGTLPQVCWLTPTPALSEHPPSNIPEGMWYVTDLVNAVMESSYWKNCAIIIMWDDYGGFYDHVPPVQTDEYGFGIRVPALVISPYSNRGVVHTQYDLTSPLKLIETKFGLPPLTARDAMSNTMLECFDFTQTPLPPVIITRETQLDFSDMVTTKP